MTVFFSVMVNIDGFVSQISQVPLSQNAQWRSHKPAFYESVIIGVDFFPSQL
jgi:hypothetical protein